MKVLLVVSIHDKPFGGHYQTTFSYISAIRNSGFECNLIVIGNEEPLWLKKDQKFIYFSGLNLIQALNEFLKESRKYDVLHAFDEFAYLFIRYAKSDKKVYTRCGGPNPHGRYFPLVKNLICLSKENFDFFESNSRIENCELISNRVPYFDIDLNKSNDLINRYNLNDKTIKILRVCRIDQYYLKSIKQAIQLGEILNKNDLKTQVIIVGKVYDLKLIMELRQSYPNVVFVCDNYFCMDAKLILGLADIVIGTGRSLMEAASVGKILFSPVSNGKLPQLLSKVNISHFHKYNFSERAPFTSGYDEQIDITIELTKQGEKFVDYLTWITHFSEMNFLLDQCPKKLIKVYSMPEKNKNSIIDLIRHTFRVLSVFIRFSFKKYYESFTHN